MRVFIICCLFLLVGFNLNGQVVLVQEDFNTGSLPIGWTTNAITGSTTWSFGIDGSSDDAGMNNLDGTSLAYFDDDDLGSASTNNRVELVSPVFNNVQYAKTTLEFDYNFRQFNAPADRFYVEVFDGMNWVTVFSRSNDDCGRWTSPNCTGNYPHANIDISAYANANCQVRFKYEDGNDWSWYVGIDNVVVRSITSFDVGVSELISLISHCGLTMNEQIEVNVVNYGADTVTNFSIVCDINNGNTILIDTFNTLLLPFDTLSYTFSPTANLSAVGIYNIKLYTVLALDTVNYNDSTLTIIEHKPEVLPPFTDDFEGINNWTVGGVNPSWQLGVPNGLIIDTAFSGTKAYVTNLNGNYNTTENSYLYSPCFNLNNIRLPKVSFNLNYVTEPSFDILLMDYSIDGGVSWSKINGELNSLNWYAHGGAWSDTSFGWLHVQNVLVSLMGEKSVEFRFRFQSDGSVNREGIAIDDFSIVENDSIDIEMQQIVYPITSGANICGFGNESIEVQLQNNGSSAIDSLVLYYQVNNGGIFSDTLITNFPSFSQLNYTFKDQYNFSNAASYNLRIWVKAKGDTIISNDSLEYILQNPQSFVGYTLPYLETFDPPNFISGTDNFNVNDVLGNGWSRSGTFSWKMANSTIYRTKNTGPNFDYNGSGSLFAYAESNLGAIGDSAILESPCIDLSGVDSATLSFKYYRYGDTSMAPFFVDVFNGQTWSLLTEVYNNPQNSGTESWTNHSVSLNDYARKKIKIRFRTIKATCCRQDMAIDNILIHETMNTDLSISNTVITQEECSIADSMQIVVRNEGFQSLSGSFPIAYSINGGGAQSRNIVLSSPLSPDSFITITINQLNFSPRIEHKISAWVDLTNDQNHLNDTTQFFIAIKEQVANLYSEDFDLFIDGSCGNIPDANLGDLLQNGWQEKSASSFRWHLQNGVSCNGTPSLSTGPLRDHTNGRGNFMYTEASGGVSVEPALLESPCIDFSNKTTAGMQFWYHRYGSDMEVLYVDVYANGTWNLGIDSLTGQSQTSSLDPWLLKKVRFDQFAGQSIKVRFRGFRGAVTNAINGDMSIDDVDFYSPILQDARSIDVNVLKASCIKDSAQVQLTVNNLGNDTIVMNALKVYYLNNGVPTLVDSNASVIPTDSNVVFHFNVYNLYGQGSNYLTTWVELSGDSNALNDTIQYDFSTPNKTPVYIEGFEDLITQAAQCGNFNPALNLSWEIDSNDQWVLGNHIVCNYNGSATPNNLSGPDSAYLGNSFIYFEPAFNTVTDTAVLNSTCIDLRNDTNATLEFYYHMYGAGIGKLYIDGITTSGSWVRLDSIVGPNQFSGSDAWSLKSIPVNQFSGQVARFRFVAVESGNSSISAQGNIALDDIRIHNALLTSLPREVMYEKKNSIFLFPNPTEGKCFIQLHAEYINSTYRIFDIRGRSLVEGRISNEMTSIDLSEYGKGLYFLKVEGIAAVKKIIIQ